MLLNIFQSRSALFQLVYYRVFREREREGTSAQTNLLLCFTSKNKQFPLTRWRLFALTCVWVVAVLMCVYECGFACVCVCLCVWVSPCCCCVCQASAAAAELPRCSLSRWRWSDDFWLFGRQLPLPLPQAIDKLSTWRALPAFSLYLSLPLSLSLSLTHTHTLQIVVLTRAQRVDSWDEHLG